MVDLRYSARLLCRRPGRTALGVGVLALGIGLATATFSIVDGVLWRPLDLPRSEELVAVVEAGSASASSIPAADYRYLREQQTSFDVLSAHLTFYTVVTPDVGASQSFVGSYITSDFLDLIGVQPILGRGFLPEDAQAGAEPTALLSHRAWRNHFGGSDDFIVRRMLINDESTTVIGILPEGVHFPYRHDIWLPLSLDAAEERGWSLFVVGRLADGSPRALGATPRRLLTLLAAETTLLVGAGGAVGLAIAWCIAWLYRAYVLPSIGMRAYWIDARIDPRAAAAALSAAALAALLGGLLPACWAILRDRRHSVLAGRSTGRATPSRARARPAVGGSGVRGASGLGADPETLPQARIAFVGAG